MSISKILFSFSGRISRSTFWLASLGINVALLVYALAVGIIAGAARTTVHSGSPDLTLLLLPMYFFVIWATLAVHVKRWHDRGKSGVWVLIGCVPYVGLFWSLIELGFLEGTPAPNDYGQGADWGDM